MKSLQDVLNEDSAAEIQADKAPGQGDSKNLIPLKAGKFNKKSLLRTMKKPEGVIQTSDGQQFTIAHARIDGNTDRWGDESVFGTDQDGGDVEINYDDIASYSEARDEDDAMVVRSMTYDNADMPKTKIDLLACMKRELRGMKVADLKASYQYIKGAHCNTKEGMQGIGTKRDMLTAMMKDLRGMKKDALTASYGYIKSAHCQPHEGDMVNASSCTSESVDLEEMKTKDDDLAVMIYDFIGADTEGLPLKTLIHQAVGKYFGSQKDKKKQVAEARITSTSKSQKTFDAVSEIMTVVNSIDRNALNTLWDYKIDRKRPIDVDGAIFPLHKSATLKIFNVRGEDPFTDEQKKYLLDIYKQAQKGKGFGVGRKWYKMEFSRDGMEATAEIHVRSNEILAKNKF